MTFPRSPVVVGRDTVETMRSIVMMEVMRNQLPAPVVKE